jgi:acyl phosphate:glycerol-3-phosphate acyltransferase
MTLLQACTVILVAYLLGSIPWGYVMGRIYGVDVRQYGSGRTGGTNLARLVGWPKTIPVAILDPAKAIIAIWIARYVTHNEWIAVCAALAAIAGHNWPIYLRFRGGRGVGPTVGGMLVFEPLIAVISMLSGVGVAAGSRYASLGSICGAALTIGLSAAGYIATWVSAPHFVYALLACGLIIAQHKDNMQRLMAGTERKLGERVPLNPAKSP